jgi:hypothetical protein
VARHPELPHARNWFELPDDVGLPRRDFKALLKAVFGDVETPGAELRQQAPEPEPETPSAPSGAPAHEEPPAHDGMPQVMSYIMACPMKRQSRLFVLHSYILAECPHVDISLQDGRPTYEFGGRRVAIADTGEQVALYVDDAESLAEFRAASPGVQAAKTRVNFMDGKDIPQSDIRAVIRKALAPPKPFGFDVA